MEFIVRQLKQEIEGAIGSALEQQSSGASSGGSSSQQAPPAFSLGGFEASEELQGEIENLSTLPPGIVVSALCSIAQASGR